MFAALKKKETYVKYLDSLKFAFYCLTHPMDGFWDLTHEKRGSLAVANTILFLTILARIMQLQFTSFIFIQVYWEDINIFLYIGSILFPLALWCVGNWGLTTLFEGKAKLKQIYMATCYAFLPYPLIQFPLIVFSNFVTVDEREFYSLIAGFSLVWAVFLIIFGMMQIHEYKLGKTLFFCVATLFAMLVEVFILLLFFSMIGQGISYFISMGREIIFRMQ